MGARHMSERKAYQIYVRKYTLGDLQVGHRHRRRHRRRSSQRPSRPSTASSVHTAKQKPRRALVGRPSLQRNQRRSALCRSPELSPPASTPDFVITPPPPFLRLFIHRILCGRDCRRRRCCRPVVPLPFIHDLAARVGASASRIWKKKCNTSTVTERSAAAALVSPKKIMELTIA